jgi:hypothetical protein
MAIATLKNIYFKMWNPETNSWGPPLDATKLVRTYDMGGTTLSFSNGETMIKRPNYNRKLLGTQKKLPIPIAHLNSSAGITIKGLNTSNFGTLPVSGDPSGAKVAVGFEYIFDPAMQVPEAMPPMLDASQMPPPMPDASQMPPPMQQQMPPMPDTSQMPQPPMPPAAQMPMPLAAEMPPQ